MRALAGLTCCLTLLAARPEARACGGFFCTVQPIDQTGEKILFALDERGIEVHVQISYTGNDTDFAWVVPTRRVPALSLGVDQLFTVLGQRTAPRFNLRWHFPDRCQSSPGPYFDAATDMGARDLGAGVTVVAQEQVGPYDSAIVSADNPTALINWLRENGYNLTPTGERLLAPYVDEHDFFVALKLRADRHASDIQPIVLRFAGNEPCVPLRLTAVAATYDMEVTTFLLARARAVPTNYYEVKLDLARLDWLSGGSNYKELMSAAAREAGGNAFATEYAGSSNLLAGALDTGYDTGRLRPLTDPIAYVAELLRQSFPRTAQMQNLLRRWIPEPQSLRDRGISEAAFYNCLQCYRRELEGFAFDAAGMTDDLETTLVRPLRSAQALFDRLPYLTRLYTRISPPDMTRDPIFTFNPDLPAVSNVHTADAYAQCNSPIIRLVLEDGRTLFVRRGGGREALDALPAAESWWQMGSSGPGRMVHSSSAEIDRQLAALNRGLSGNDGCGMAGGGAPIALVPLLVMAVAAVSRIRRGGARR